jgi:hypothetical protein
VSGRSLKSVMHSEYIIRLRSVTWIRQSLFPNRLYHWNKWCITYPLPESVVRWVNECTITYFIQNPLEDWYERIRHIQPGDHCWERWRKLSPDAHKTYHLRLNINCFAIDSNDVFPGHQVSWVNSTVSFPTKPASEYKPWGWWNLMIHDWELS